MKVNKQTKLKERLESINNKLASIYKECRSLKKCQDGSDGMCWHYRGGSKLLEDRENTLLDLCDELGEELRYFTVTVEPKENGASTTYGKQPAMGAAMAREFIERMHYPKNNLLNNKYKWITKDVTWKGE